MNQNDFVIVTLIFLGALIIVPRICRARKKPNRQSQPDCSHITDYVGAKREQVNR